MKCLRLRFVSLILRIYGGVCLLIVSALISQIALAGDSPANNNKHDLDLDVDPPFTFVNKSKDIKFSVLMKKGVDDVVDTVRLVETNAEGSPIAEIGVMNDDGRDGDFEAKDWEYTLTLVFNEPMPVIRYYQIVVSLKNDSRKILSQARKFRITEEPFYKEYDENKVVQEGSGSRFPVNRVLVELREEDNRPVAEALARSVGGTVVGYTFTSNEYSLEVPVETIEALEAVIEKLKNDPRTLGAGKAYIFRVFPE